MTIDRRNFIASVATFLGFGAVAKAKPSTSKLRKYRIPQPFSRVKIKGEIKPYPLVVSTGDGSLRLIVDRQGQDRLKAFAAELHEFQKATFTMDGGPELFVGGSSLGRPLETTVTFTAQTPAPPQSQTDQST